MGTHTQAQDILVNGYITLKMPVSRGSNGAWKPKYDPKIDYNIPNADFKRYYKQRYYPKSYLHYLFDKLTLKHPQAFRFWVEVAIKRSSNTARMIEELMGKEDVELIETPEKYRFESKEVPK